MRVIDILASPWAIVPDRLDELTRIYSTHLRGEKIDVEGLEARIGVPLSRKEQGYDVVDGVAIIPVDGIIGKKMNLFSQISGGASTQLIERDFVQAMDDPAVTSIILHADTPGGSVDGTAELGEVIFNARGRKPIYALADGLMASAGVWIGTAADKVFITGNTTHVGSIGVVTQHVDRSEQARKMGVKVTEIYAGRYKRIATQHAPLSEEGRGYLQEQVDYLYSIFVDTVAKHRGTSSEDVLEHMADGKLFVGQQAIDAGLVDGVSTLDQLIETLSNAGPTNAPAGAQRGSVSPETAEQTETNQEESTMDLAELKDKHPELFQAAFDEGNAAGLDEGQSQGAKNERERIKAVRGQSLPGHEALIEKMAFDGETTGDQAATAVLQAERELRKSKQRARQDDAADLNDVDSTVETDNPPKANEPVSLEDKAKAEWDRDANLRAEFENDFGRYEAYAKASAGGRMKVLGGKG